MGMLPEPSATASGTTPSILRRWTRCAAGGSRTSLHGNTIFAEDFEPGSPAGLKGGRSTIGAMSSLLQNATNVFNLNTPSHHILACPQLLPGHTVAVLLPRETADGTRFLMLHNTTPGSNSPPILHRLQLLHLQGVRSLSTRSAQVLQYPWDFRDQGARGAHQLRVRSVDGPGRIHVPGLPRAAAAGRKRKK